MLYVIMMHSATRKALQRTRGEHGDNVVEEEYLEREDWFVLQAERPGVRAWKLARSYGLVEKAELIGSAASSTIVRPGGTLLSKISRRGFELAMLGSLGVRYLHPERGLAVEAAGESRGKCGVHNRRARRKGGAFHRLPPPNRMHRNSLRRRGDRRGGF